MARYQVRMSESVYYEVTVTADSVEQARERAEELHENGEDVEVDNGGLVIDAVNEVV